MRNYADMILEEISARMEGIIKSPQRLFVKQPKGLNSAQEMILTLAKSLKQSIKNGQWGGLILLVINLRLDPYFHLACVPFSDNYRLT
jgi:hypothetical protein